MSVDAAKRGYTSPLRAQRAAQTRRRVIEAAAAGFAERGFVGTTLASIAAQAGVSVDSVVSVGSKAYLLLEAFRTRYAGTGDWESLLDASTAQEILAMTDRDEGLEAMIAFLADGHARSADLWTALRATAQFEPVVAEGLAELVRLKGESFEVTTRWMLDLGILEPVDEADVWALTVQINLVSAAETYTTLVRDYGYTDEQYRAWLRRTLPVVRP